MDRFRGNVEEATEECEACGSIACPTLTWGVPHAECDDLLEDYITV